MEGSSHPELMTVSLLKLPKVYFLPLKFESVKLKLLVSKTQSLGQVLQVDKTNISTSKKVEALRHCPTLPKSLSGRKSHTVVALFAAVQVVITSYICVIYEAHVWLSIISERSIPPILVRTLSKVVRSYEKPSFYSTQTTSAANVTETKLAIELRSSPNVGYIALGFGRFPSMQDADVYYCTSSNGFETATIKALHTPPDTIPLEVNYRIGFLDSSTWAENGPGPFMFAKAQL